MRTLELKSELQSDLLSDPASFGNGLRDLGKGGAKATCHQLTHIYGGRYLSYRKSLRQREHGC